MNSIVNTHNSHAVHGKKPVSKGVGPEAEGDATGMPGEFSGLFAALMNGKAGQVFAAGEGKASPEANELAAETLSPSVNIITASTPALNDESLQAFARSQGMDEAAMALIFQGKAPATALTPTVSPDLPASISAVSTVSTVSMVSIYRYRCYRFNIFYPFYLFYLFYRFYQFYRFYLFHLFHLFNLSYRFYRFYR